MVGAAVPEATVNEDGHPAPREDDVGPHPDVAGTHTKILAESVAEAMERTPQSDLGLGVHPADRLHIAAAALTRWRRMETATSSLGAALRRGCAAIG